MKRKALSLLLAVAGTLLLVGGALADGSPQTAPVPQAAGEEGCLSCHAGIEDIRPPDSPMMQQIQAIGQCTACHGGDPTVTGTPDDTEAAAKAHSGDFYPDPGDLWVADKTCGKCHPGYTYALERSLMNTEAGKIQGNLWAWGVKDEKYGEGRNVRFGNYDVVDEDGTEPIFGTDAYKAYMQALMEAFPEQFPHQLEALPLPSLEEIQQHPELAAFTYQRNQCQRCHVGGPPRMKRGDYRGTGCSSCHIPYSNEGFYEGNDPTIPKDQPGHPLVHQIQATRETKVTVNGRSYSGIPVETCNSCHNRGKRIGVSFEGLMEFPYGTPFDEQGQIQPKLHTKKYLFIQDDIHHAGTDPEKGGMLCQDCHTSIDMHGDGNIFGTTLAQVEIECADCHGTPDAYPWELPLGFQEESFADKAQAPSDPRGVATSLPSWMTFGTIYPPEDGYLLTARGNPFGNVVRQGNQVILHSANGKDFEVPLLKNIKEQGTWSSKDADVAMDKVKGHMENMECYACHSSWAPQCYGCHVVVDYSNGNQGTDWNAVSRNYRETGNVDYNLTLPGKVKEGRAYLRWEDPILGVNGEGRVTPLIPGCQVVFTVIGPNGETLIHNEIGRTPPNEEGAGAEGQRGMDMAPAQPHTVGRQARTCESCHSDPKALGYGVQRGIFLQGYEQDRYVDLLDAQGEVVSAQAQVQLPGIPDLPFDWSQIVNPDTGEQQMTVGSHWPGSGPLPEETRTKMERVGVCMGCHQNMTDPAFWNEKVIAAYGRIVSNDDHIKVMNQVIQDAVTGKEKINELTNQVEDLQAQLEQAKTKSETQATPAEEPSPSNGFPWGPVAAALAIGLLLGWGVMAARKK